MAPRLLIITLEPISKQMAGPAIRCLEIGRQLSDEFEVTVFSPCPTDFNAEELNLPGLRVVTGLGKGKLYSLAKENEILFIQANVLKPYPKLADLGKYLVVDLYDPYLLSVLAQYKEDSSTGSTSYRLMHQVLEKHMLKADFAICASERQRDYWIGRYCALGRLTPETYKFDPSFRKLIGVVPFGLPGVKAVRNGPGIKGQVNGINHDDQVLIWGGGLWEWFDPLTVIEAVARLSKTHPRLKLFFMGWKSPNPQVPLMEMAVKARSLAMNLGVLDTHVFFHESWVAYNQRANYLLDADIAVSAHFDLPETRFSFRTRILDYFWAQLPILTTGGDQLADLIESHSAGMALPYGDVTAWTSAISALLDDNTLQCKFKSGSQALAETLTWEKAVKSLREFCRKPYHLPTYSAVKMPSLIERARSVYSRGGADLVLQRSKSMLEDLIGK